MIKLSSVPTSSSRQIGADDDEDKRYCNIVCHF